MTGEVQTYDLPGLADVHVHLTDLEDIGAFRRAGVTAVRDLGGSLQEVRAQADLPGAPAVVSFGGAVDAAPVQGPLADRFGMVGVRHFGEVLRQLDQLARAGCAGMKLYQGFPPELVAPTVRAAHDRDLRVAHHIGSGSLPAFHRSPPLMAVRAGVDSVEHIHSFTAALIEPDQLADMVTDPIDTVGAAFGRVFLAWARVDLDGPRVREVVRTVVDSGTVVVPTLAPFAAMADDSTGGGLLAAWSRTREVPTDLVAAGLSAMLDFVGQLHAAGGKLAVGTDAASGTGINPGKSFWREMALLLAAGLTAHDVIMAGSPRGHTADRLGLSGRYHPDNHRVYLQAPNLATAIQRPEILFTLPSRPAIRVG